MKRFLRAVSVALGLLAFSCLAAEPEVQITSAAFGVLDVNKSNELSFEPTNVVPHRLKQRYGWVIELQTKKRRVSVREEYLLPPRPQSAEEQASGAIPMERRSQVSQRALVPIDGKIYGEWAVGPNEPAGHRHLQVFVEDELAGDFEFDVR
ncbi:MAG: hypothetical protein KGL40_03875 [Rhodocyclaceae bacterium]|nr:hypothetical protein [Rhodocyclaceae bacterium]